MAAVILQEISKDEHERARLRSRRMYETDMESDRLTSEEIGELRSDAKWQLIMAEKDKEWQAIIADHKLELADQKAEIAQLRKELEKQGK